MAFGFVVEKFALFIKQFANFFGTQALPEIPSQGSSSIFGIFLVGAGALLGLLAFIKFMRVEKQIEEDNYKHSATLAVLLTSLVVIVGIFLAVYLINT